LKVAKNGQITFASGQTFPGTGTITGITAGTDLTGGGTSGHVTLNVNTSALNSTYAQLNAPNTFSANQTVNGTITATDLTPGASVIYGTSFNGQGVAGIDTGSGYGVYGQSNSGLGVYGGSNTFTGVSGASGSNVGVFGFSENAQGVQGQSLSTIGVEGDSSSTSYYGVYGSNTASGGGYGVYGYGYVGVAGASNGGNAGVYATSDGGWAVDAYGTGGATGVLGGSDTGYAGWFNGNVNVEGTLSASTKDFKIDHPSDPANKYLVHASVESSEMMNIYTGNVTTDAAGLATVQLPDWFEALNTDFRYQLTVIGQFAQAIVAHEIEQHQFEIKTSLPNVKVSWQITGVRQDAYAKAHPLQVEEEKAEKERGFYIHPELFGAPREKGILWATAPAAMKQWQEVQAKNAAARKSATRK
jgi:trimeric autotransporter adhesin